MKNKDDQQKQIAKLRKQAEAVAREKVAQSSENLDVMSPKEIRQIVHELQVHQIELEMQNEELRRVQANLDKSVERYFDFYNIAPVGYLTISEKGLIIEANLTIATFLGVEKATLIKKLFTSFVFPEDQDLYYKYCKQNFKIDTGALQACELRMMKKDGTHFWVRMESTTVQGGNGELAYRVVISDITARKKIERELEKSEIKYRTVVEHIPKKVFIKDKNSVYIFCNKNYADDLKIAPETIVGKTDFDFFTKNLAEKYRSDDKKIMETGKIEDIEERYIEQGEERWVHTIKIPYKDEKGETIGVVGLSRDITERKRAEDEVNLRNKELFALNAIATIASSSLDLQRILDLTLDKVLEVAELEVGSIYLLDKQVGEVVLATYRGATKKFADEVRTFKLGESLVGRAAQSGQPIVADNVTQDSRVTTTLVNGEKIRSFAAIPMKSKDKVLGVMNIASHQYHSFASEAIKFYCAIGNQIGMAIQNARQYEATQQELIERKKAEEKLEKSKAKLESIFDSSPNAITVTDLSGNIVECNQATLDAHGFSSKDEVLGKTAFMLIAEKDQKRATDNMMKTLEQGVIKNAEYTLCKKDKSEFAGELSASVMKDAHGKPIGFVAITKDITERKRAEAKIKTSERKLQSVFASSPDPIFSADLNGNITDCNQATLDFIGVQSKEELFGTPALSMLIENHRGKIAEDMRKCMDGGGTIKDAEYTFITRDGRKIDSLVSASVLKDESGKSTGFMAVVKDITERKKSEEEIKKQNIELKKLDHIKTNFLNVTSHELRTPMASIKGYVQMILKGKLGDLTEEERNALEVVLRNTNRLDRLVQDILDISLLESESMKFIPEKTNIKDVVSEIVESMNCRALEKNIKIITEIDENLPDFILDKERIRQVIINLIDNSLKFSPYGTTVNIRGKKQQKEFLFELQDQGRGIPKDHQEKIFGLFYQVDSGEDRKYGGAGLGLAISKSIIDIHGGKLWVESAGEPGKGSIFKFVLPMNSEDYLKTNQIN